MKRTSMKSFDDLKKTVEEDEKEYIIGNQVKKILKNEKIIKNGKSINVEKKVKDKDNIKLNLEIFHFIIF